MDYYSLNSSVIEQLELLFSEAEIRDAAGAHFHDSITLESRRIHISRQINEASNMDPKAILLPFQNCDMIV